MKQVMELQYLSYSSGPSRILGVEERWVVMDGEKERSERGEGRGGEKGSAPDPCKRIGFVECQLEEGSPNRDLNTGSIIVH